MLGKLANMSESEFEEMAALGVIGPYSNDFNCIGDVLEHRKPIAIVEDDFGVFAMMFNYKYNAGLKISPTRLGSAVYRDHWTYSELCKILDINPKTESKHIYFDVKFGLVLGYKEEDIVRFLQHNYSYEKVQNALKRWKNNLET